MGHYLEMKLALVQASDDKLISALKPYMEVALRYTEGRENWDSLLCKMKAEEHHWWALLDGDELHGILVTVIVQDGDRTVVRYAVVAGDGVVKNVEYIVSVVNGWAKDYFGATQAEIIGRKGWGKLFRSWREYTYLIRDI